jgi:hypothetical protein
VSQTFNQPYAHWFDLLSRVKELSRDGCDRLLVVRDLGTAIEPITLDLELNVLPIRSILEGNNALTAHELELALHFEVVTIRRLAMEGLMNGHELIGQGEELLVLHVGELLAVTQTQHFALAFADVETLGGLDGEVIAGKGEDLFLEGESDLVRVVELCAGWLGPEGWIEWSERRRHYQSSVWDWLEIEGCWKFAGGKLGWVS